MVTDAEIAADWERICKEEMGYIQRVIGELNAIREDLRDNWEMEEFLRVGIHNNVQRIAAFREEIEGARETLKKSA